MNYPKSGTEIIHLSGGDAEKITKEMVFEAARKNDSVAQEILEFVGLNLGVRLAYLSNVFKPKTLLLGGGIEKAEDFFIEPLKKSTDMFISQKILKDIKVVKSVSGSDAPLKGAAGLVIREIFMEG